MAPWARLLVQLGVSFGNVFIQAFSQALHQAQSGGGQAAASEASRRIMGRMSKAEAMKILNVSEGSLTHLTVRDNFEKIFKLNDPNAGGSYYLQCKAEHAKNTLDEEIVALNAGLEDSGIHEGAADQSDSAQNTDSQSR